MPLSFNYDAPGRDLNSVGQRLECIMTVTGPASYDANGGGEVLDPGHARIGVVEKVDDVFFSDGTSLRLARYIPATGRLRFWVPNTGAEVAHGVNLSAFTAVMRVVGY